MRTLLIAVATMLSGCGTGVSPELYDVVLDHFAQPDTCFTSGMQPNSLVISEPPSLMQVQVWEGPEDTAYLEIETGGGTVDLGDAPSAKLSGIFNGKKADKGWTFTSDSVEKQTVGGDNVVVDTTHVELTFERSRTFKGTGSIASSRTCTGNLCTGMNRSCAVSSLVLSGTRLEVEYQRAP